MGERTIVVGAGGISNAWFPPLKAEGVEVVAVVDLHRSAAEAQIGKYELAAEASDDLAGMLRKYRPDFVVDMTIPDAHGTVTCMALETGSHVIGEKPMASNMEEARRMVRTAEQTGKLYMVSQSRRWDNKHDRIRRTVTGGALGPVTTINCDFYIGAHFGGFRDAMPSPLILDMAIHHFDMARFMTGADPAAVYALEFNPEGSWYAGDVAATCVFEMTNGAVFTYRGSWCAEGCMTSWNGDWRIIGPQGTLLYEQDNDPYGQIVAATGGFTSEMAPLEVAPSPLEFGGMHGALREMLDFLRTGKVPQTECHDNIQSLAMVFSAIESARLQQRIPVQVM